jgi:hypothetical protein
MKTFERNLLIRLAPVWLACRWRVMGHPLRSQDHWPKPDLAFDLLGMLDYGNEMRLECQEKLRMKSASHREGVPVLPNCRDGRTPNTDRP